MTDNKLISIIKAEKIDALIAQQKITNETLARMDERQSKESHNGKKWTFLTVAIMVLAFYVEIVKIDDISILKDRAMDFVYNITGTYPVKVD